MYLIQRSHRETSTFLADDFAKRSESVPVSALTPKTSTLLVDSSAERIENVPSLALTLGNKYIFGG